MKWIKTSVKFPEVISSCDLSCCTVTNYQACMSEMWQIADILRYSKDIEFLLEYGFLSSARPCLKYINNAVVEPRCNERLDRCWNRAARPIYLTDQKLILIPVSQPPPCSF